MLKLLTRGNWYAVQIGKNSRGVTIPKHTLGIRVYKDAKDAKKGKPDKELKKAAEAKILEYEQLTEWHGPHPRPKAVTIQPEGLTLHDLYTEWLRQKKEGSSTWRCYRTVKDFLLAPLALQDITLAKDVTGKHLLDLYSAWKADGEYFNTMQSWRKFSSSMFNHGVRYYPDQLKQNPWRLVDKSVFKPIKPTEEEIMIGAGKDNGEGETDNGIATLPLDTDSSQRNWLLVRSGAAAFARGEIGSKRRRHNAIWQHPDSWPTWLWLMYETGLRKSDAVIFRPDLIRNTKHGGAYHIKAQIKTGDPVTVFLIEELRDQLRALPLLPWRGARHIYEQATGREFVPGAGLYPFYDGSCASRESYVHVNLNKPLAKLGKLIGIEELRPHRLRDSFAVNELKRGMMLQDVQRLLGHSLLETTQKHYAPYVLGMQEAVEKRQAAARRAEMLQEAPDAFPELLSVN